MINNILKKIQNQNVESKALPVETDPRLHGLSGHRLAIQILPRVGERADKTHTRSLKQEEVQDFRGRRDLMLLRGRSHRALRPHHLLALENFSNRAD